MIALVFSGAANFGAMQAGALEIVMRSGIKPRMLVGSSAGALNAIYLAADPTSERVAQLQAMWRDAGPSEVGVPKPFIALRRIVQQKDGLIDSSRLSRFLKERLPAKAETFAELEGMQGVKTYVAAVELETGTLRIFGDNPEDGLLDAAMASTAIPPYFPPWKVGQQHYLDGGLYAKLPLCVAIERGATQIIALDVTYPMGSATNAHGIMGVSGYSLSLMIQAQTAFELAWARITRVPIRLISLEAPVDVPFWDYTQASFLIERGREMAQAELEAEPLKNASAMNRMLGFWRKSRRQHPLASMPQVGGGSDRTKLVKNRKDPTKGE